MINNNSYSARTQQAIKRSRDRRKKKKAVVILQNFKSNIEDRKVLVKRIEELTGQKAAYSFVPRCAYVFEGCAIEKDGSLSIEEGMDLDVVRILLAECLIIGRIELPKEEPKATPDEIRKKLLEGYGDKEITEAEAMEPLGLINPDIAFPMADQTQRSIRNLLNLIYSRGALISKATRGNFSVPKGLIDALSLKADFDSVDELVDFIDDYLEEHEMEIEGLDLTPERITFTGYPVTDDRDVVHALMQLTAMMIRQCIEQRVVLARVVEPVDGNEKYVFRTWLIRGGMNGPEYKETRDYLLFPLEGDAAFGSKKSADKRRRKLDAEKEARQQDREQKENKLKEQRELIRGTA